MHDTANQRSLPWLVGLIAIVAVVGGGLALGVGRSEPGSSDQLPAAPVRGMADPNASALPAGEEDITGRPVLQVTTGVGGAIATSEPAEEGTPTTPAPITVSTVDPATSTVTGPEASEPVTTLPPVSDPSTSSTSIPADGSTTSMPPAGDPTTTSTVAAGGLNPVELELARLTNELRTNPNGPLRREGPVIDCDGRVPIDPATGLYQPIGALTLDTPASVQVAREWSAQLTTDLQHRPQAGIAALQAAGINVAAAGENIAYHNFPDTASRHFVGWRESDGHFCNMMDPTFTHVGVGEVTRTDGFSFATQNFFSLRSEG